MGAVGAGRSSRVRVTTRAEGDLAVHLDGSVLEARRAAVVDRPWFWLNQVHGTDVVVALDATTPTGPTPGVTADAVITRSTDWVLAVHTADCAPVALLGDGGVIGAVHAGWRGLAGGVIERTVEAMRAAGAGNIRARLGPCIHRECYAFGAADLAALVERFGADVAGETPDHLPAFDVPAAVGVALGSVGVDDLVIDPACTSCDVQYYSHRARQESGRQALLVWQDSDD